MYLPTSTRVPLSAFPDHAGVIFGSSRTSNITKVVTEPILWVQAIIGAIDTLATSATKGEDGAILVNGVKCELVTREA
jgi:hypothetical protein